MARQDKIVVNGVSRSAWIRRQLVKNPNITVEAMQSAYTKSKFPQNQPITMQHLLQGRSQLKGRYGFSEQGMAWKDFPIAGTTGKANVSAFIRLYLDTFEDSSLVTEADAVEFMSMDGFSFHGGVFRNVRSKLKNGPAPVEAEAEAEDDDAPIQSSTEPRAGKTGKRKYKRRGKKAKTGDEHPLLETYEGMEKGLDGLIAEAQALKNWPVVEALKDARRRTSVAIVHFSD